MSAVQRLVEGVRQASAIARPWSRESIAARNRNQAEMLMDYICRGDSVLDVGCGTGFLTKCVEETFGVAAMGLDVQDCRVAQIPFREFDGISIPFPDQAFDHVILSFTLHHCHDPLALIKECRRVARRNIMAFEDLPESRFGRMLVALHVEKFRRRFRLEQKGGDYRAALAWLNDHAFEAVRAAMRNEWFDHLYVPRYLLVYKISGD